MDLKSIHEDCLILHLIDMFTRFSVAGVIPDKNKTTIINMLFAKWIAYFGRPNKFMADNGGEFCNTEYVDLCENFNIEIQNSAAESPFSNGMVERHNMVLAQAVVKTKEDIGCSWKIALSWALSAKNSLQSINGYSAHQLVFGRNPPLPNVVVNKLPALEAQPVSNIVAENLSAMHKAREAFVQTESCNKIRKALRSQVRTCNDNFFENGQKVFYKRAREAKWRGPAVVLGRDGHSYLVKHSFNFLKVHPRDMQVYPGSQEDDIFQRAGNGKDVNIDNCSSSSNEITVCSRNGSSPKSSKIDDRVNSFSVPSWRGNSEICDEGHNVTENSNLNGNVMSNKMRLPKVKTYVEYLPKNVDGNEVNDWKGVYIHSRAGKATGKYANSLNVKMDGEDDITCVNWHELAADWKEKEVPMENQEEVLITNSVKLHDQLVIDAKQVELKKLVDNDVYVEVPDEGQETVTVKWVVTKKYDSVKGRLVARCFEEQTDHIERLPYM